MTSSEVGAPDREEREWILEVHTADVPLASDVRLDELAAATDGYVGSDIETVVQEAALAAIRERHDRSTVAMAHFREAIDEVCPTRTESVERRYVRIEEEFQRLPGVGTEPGEVDGRRPFH